MFCRWSFMERRAEERNKSDRSIEDHAERMNARALSGSIATSSSGELAATA